MNLSWNLAFYIAIIAVSFLPPLAIEIGFIQPTVEHNESQAHFLAFIEKSRPSEQTFVIQISISSFGVQPATSGSDFEIGGVADGMLTVRLLPAENSTVVAYWIFEDNIAENTEVFQLFSYRVPGTPNFFCDAGPMSPYNGYECFPGVQVLILDDDGEPLLFVGVMIIVCYSWTFVNHCHEWMSIIVRFCPG